MVEVTGALEASFDAIEREDDAVEALKAEVAALRARVERQGLAAARPALSGVKSEGSAFVERYLRKGIESGIELKAMTGTSDAAGGYAVPEEIDEAIDRALTAVSPIRAIANVVKVGSAGYRKLVTTGGTPSGWVSEDAARPETGTPNFTEIAPPFGELYANPAASQAMLDDAAFDVEAWLAQEIATEFARAEGAAFVSGNGVNKPRGFLAAPTSAQGDGVRPFGTLQTIATGTAGAFPVASPQDKLIDLVQALRPPYRQGAVFVMNSATAARIRKFKTSDGAFLWQPGLDRRCRCPAWRGAGTLPAAHRRRRVRPQRRMPRAKPSVQRRAASGGRRGWRHDHGHAARYRRGFAASLTNGGALMMETTARHGLPLLAPGQAQKEFFHNEALTIADMAMHACVEEAARSEPPADPSPGNAG